MNDLDDSLWPESLRRYDIIRETIADNLALDEALLLAVDADPQAASLRFWESPEFCVVLGRSNRVETEVNIEACRKEAIPVVRRLSGGGTVLIGPGCLCYALTLPLTDRLRSMGISQVTMELMNRMARAIRGSLASIAVRGTSDLVFNDRKISGNAQRWLRRSFVHHGTILYDFDLTKLERLLNHPTREPVYRAYRGHADFVTNIPIAQSEIRELIAGIWNARASDCPLAVLEAADQLAKTRYRSGEWSY